jgi:hypothetical protein
MTADPRPEPHGNLARLADDPLLLAHPLALYQRRHGLGDLALAAELHCDPSALTLLRVCWMPRAGERFGADVAAVCGRFGCDRAALRRILEETSGPPR